MNKQLSPMEQFLKTMIRYRNEELLTDEQEKAVNYAINTATELLTSSYKVVTTEEVYRWVKASERLPRNGWHLKSVRMIHTKVPILDAERLISEQGHENIVPVIEWLEPISISDLYTEEDMWKCWVDAKYSELSFEQYINSLTNTGNNG